MQQENPTPQDEAANQEQEQTETPNVDVVPDMQEALQTAERKAQEHYDWSRVFPQLMHRYGSLLAARPGAARALERVFAPD